jgi:cobalt/nickel transport system ATP-binding protein
VAAALHAMHMEAYSGRVSHHLSMGEKKAIAIATVLSMQPEILVLDEPTAGLDPRARRSLIRRLQDLDMTMLIASHDLAMVQEAFPRMIVMDDGRIVADGESTVLLADDALLEAHGLERL